MVLQEERGIPEQEATEGGGGGGRARPARGPGQPGGQTLSPIPSPMKNPQPTMGVKRKNDSKLPPEDAVSKREYSCRVGAEAKTAGYVVTVFNLCAFCGGGRHTSLFIL